MACVWFYMLALSILSQCYIIRKHVYLCIFRHVRSQFAYLTSITHVQAYQAKMLFPHYVWITYSRNYTNAVLGGSDCTAHQVFESFDGTFSLVATIMANDQSQQLLAAHETTDFVQVVCTYILTSNNTVHTRT